ncbi:AMP-binding protein [Orrella sp. JC864]|uniref:class I adenylate-forming enzyme family protein n=1 Tax=Orrella sp. JC864 TaxID=3120298 RepID=UPI0012BCA13E
MPAPCPALIEPADVVGRYPAHGYTLPGLLQSRAAVLGDKPCLEFEHARWSYAQLDARMRRTAAWLAARGVRAGDRVGVYSANHPSTVSLLLGLAWLGAVMVPVNPEFGPAEAAYVFANADVSGVVCAGDRYERTMLACADLPRQPWIVANEPLDGAPGLAAEIDACSAPLPACAAAPEAPCVFIYTSGTTGSPKGAMHGQRGYVLTAEAFVVRLYLQPHDRAMCVLPLFHINALFYSLGGTLAAGATLVLVRRFSASAFWRVAAASRATTVNLIGAAATILAKRPREEFDAGHALTKAFVAPLDAFLLKTFQEEFHLPTLIECYGMTEIPGVLSNPFKGPRKLGSMGCVSPHLDPVLPQPELRVVDAQMRDVPPGTPGQLLVRTPTLMLGYFRDPERTAAAFHDGWFLTGDIAWQDEDGYYWFVARQKDIIRVRGENVAGAELDRVLSMHPDILEAAAIGVPAPLGEEDILAVVVPHPQARLDAQEVARWVASHLAPIKVPRYVVFTETLPKTATQRVEKFKLKAERDLLARAVPVTAQPA